MKTRRGLLCALGFGVAVGIAGCNTDSTDSPPDGDRTSTDSGTTVSERPTEKEVTPTQETNRTPAGTETTPSETATMPGDSQDPETFTEHYREWIHGENSEVLEEAQEEFNVNDIHEALEHGETRVEKVEQAVGEAATQYEHDVENYEDSHRNILSAVHQTLEQTDYDFNLYSNINWGVAGDHFEFSEIMVETENGGCETLIGQLWGDANNERQYDDQTREGSNRDVQVMRQGEEYNLHEGTLRGVQDSSNGVVLPPQDEDGFSQFAS